MKLPTLTDFLFARIAEDEERAEAATVGPWESDREAGDGGIWHVEADGQSILVAGRASDADAEHIARHDPARVLAECEAKRRLVEHAHTLMRLSNSREHDDAADGILYALALPYADHVHYRDDVWGMPNA